MHSKHGMIRSLSAFSIDQFSTRLSTLNTKVALHNTHVTASDPSYWNTFA